MIGAHCRQYDLVVYDEVVERGNAQTAVGEVIAQITVAGGLFPCSRAREEAFSVFFQTNAPPPPPPRRDGDPKKKK